MRKLTILLSLTAAILFCAGLALAEDKVEVKKVEVKLDGKQLYREMCKTCHGPEAAAGEYTPMFLIQEQWDTFFEEDYVETHTDVTYDDEKGTKVLEAITPEMLKEIRKFCHDGAADSEQPMTCG